MCYYQTLVGDVLMLLAPDHTEIHWPRKREVCNPGSTSGITWELFKIITMSTYANEI